MSNSAAELEHAPRYRQLAEQLIAQIRSGALRVGAPFPGEIKLAGRFRVSRHTVREALRVVGELGLIERRRGIGSIVRSRVPNERYVHTVRTPDELMRYPAGSHLQVVAAQKVRANRELAQLIDCKLGSAWYHIGASRRFKGTRTALCWVDIYVLPEYAPVAEWIGRKSPPVYELIEQRFGEKMLKLQVELRGGKISSILAPSLAVDPGAASLTVIRRYTGQSGRVFEVSVSEHPADRYTYSLELRRGWQAGDAWSAG